MAEPISIIGLVSGIITFVDFGFKVIAGAKNVRNSLHGFAANVHELDLIIEDVRRHNDILKEQKLEKWLSEDERKILEMVKECDSLVNGIKRIMETLRMRTEARSRTLESARVITRSFFKQGDLQALQTRLEKLDNRIRVNTASAMQRQHNSSIIKRLARIEAAQRRMDINEDFRLDAIRTDIVALTKKKEESKELWSEGRMTGLQNLSLKLGTLQKVQDICSKQVAVLESLYFTELRRRWNHIRNADQRTNEWIFDSEQTYFTTWLKSKNKHDELFYITGRAGSGKSTLMKLISEDERTRNCLSEWAGSKKLYTASFYFWNQGSELQKSGIGLLRSLLYQILRSVPSLIESVCEDRLHHEEWELEQLKEVFHKITQHTELDTNFCFFVDGLDEYDGDECDVTQLLKLLAISSRIKICVSSRPGRQYEEILPKLHQDCTIDIAHFTREDMVNYIHRHLEESVNWQRLTVLHSDQCQEIIEEISARASGVWLWVYLVTKDIVKEAAKNEGIQTLKRVVDSFPDDLQKYFELIIQKIPRIHREEMAQIFLIAIEEVQPLPLYAFALLAEESTNKNFAISRKVEPIREPDVSAEYDSLRDRIRNRCSDLLIVDDEPHPTLCLSHNVDFLHRTVRDFLRDYHDELKSNLIRNFSPLLSLIRIGLALLKGLPATNFHYRSTAIRIIGITDEILYYARELEKRGSEDDVLPLIHLLDEVDRTNCQHASTSAGNDHWTNKRDQPRFLDEYDEFGQCNWIALTVQARLFIYVRRKLNSDSRILDKRGRPLLDYALRPMRTTPISMLHLCVRDDVSIDVDMVEMLLNKGADPNQLVYRHKKKSVWTLFLLSISGTVGHPIVTPPEDSLTGARFKACRAMIQAGAHGDDIPSTRGPQLFFADIFGEDRAMVLVKELKKKKMEAEKSSSLCTSM